MSAANRKHTGRANETLFLQRQLRAQKGVAARQAKELSRLRDELAQLRLRAPMNDVLLAVMRQNNAIFELLQEHHDLQKETVLVKGSPTNVPDSKNDQAKYANQGNY